MKTLYDLFLHELKDLYLAADSMHQVLNRMSSLATHPRLTQMLDTYYAQVEYQKRKIQEFFATQSIEIGKIDSPIMNKMRDHALASMRFAGSKEIRDLALLITVNMMKHFEITAFGTILTHAKRMKREEFADMLHSIKKKIAEDEQKPIEIASQLVEEGHSSALKNEIKELLEKIVKAQIRDEDQLLKFLPKLISNAYSNDLKEALETYRSEHEGNQEKLAAFAGEFQTLTEIDEWSVMDGFTSEWNEHLSAAGPKNLKDIGIILSIQRIQHQNMALFVFEKLLSGFIGNKGMQNLFDQVLNQEKGNDQSFSAIAEGSLFKEGLDAKVKP